MANQTLSDDSLIVRLSELAKDGHIHVVVPATPSNRGSDRVDDKGLALATFRLRHAVDKLHELGVEAEGEVGHPDPIHAVARALEHEPADEIILSTLPNGVSKWLEVDLPKALEHRFGLPVDGRDRERLTVGHTRTSERNSSSFAGPMPRTLSKSSTDRNDRAASGSR